MAKKLIFDYTFDASAQTVTINGHISLKKLLFILDHRMVVPKCSHLKSLEITGSRMICLRALEFSLITKVLDVVLSL